MALPLSVRYFFARLQPLSKPVFWCPMLALGLIAGFAWQMRNDPEWLADYRSSLDTPASAPGSTSLTDEQQAGLADVDNLDVLLGESQNSSTPTQAAEKPKDGRGDQQNALLALLQKTTNQSNDQATQAQNAGSSAQSQSPFAAYLQNYTIPGSAEAIANPGNANPTPSGNSLLLNLSSPLGSALSSALFGNNQTGANPSRPMSPLEAALGLQQVASNNTNNAEDSQTASTSDPSGRTASANSPTASNTTGNTTGTATVPFSQAGVVQGSIPGSPLSFIRTTAQMSPAPGTTGYTQPTTINLLPPIGGRSNAYTSLTPATGVPLTSVPSGTSPQTSTSIGASAGVLPPLVAQPQVAQPLVETSPYGYPRAPGGRSIGGGEIYTFSNPMGLPQDLNY